MDREILFRGKRIDNGEWVEGDLIVSKKNYYIHPTHNSFQVKESGLSGPIVLHEVVQETVGQFTGLTDKNGKRIFEGDILQIAKKSDTLGTYFFPPVQYPINVVVKWDLCAWMWEVQGKEGPYYITFPDAWCHYECKVISNIHDNPALLEGE